MQANKISILITGSLEHAVEKTVGNGIELDIIPFIKTEKNTENTVFHAVREAASRRCFVVFTSEAAVHSVGQTLLERSADWKIFCMENKTRQAVEKYFDPACVCGTAENSIELAEVIKKSKAKEVIFFSGNRRRNDLLEILKISDIQVNEVMVYRTFLTPEKVTKEYDAIAFFSPSTVDSFFSLNKIDPTTILFAIGGTTATAIEKYSNNPVVISDSPGKQTLIEKIMEYFHIPITEI